MSRRRNNDSTLYVLERGEVVPIKVAKHDATHVYLRDEEGKVRKLVRNGRDSKTYYETEAQALREALLIRRERAKRAEWQVKSALEEKAEADVKLAATGSILASKGENLPGYEEAIRKEVAETLAHRSYDIDGLRVVARELASFPGRRDGAELAPYEAIELRVLREAFAEYDSEPAVRARVTKKIGDFNPSSDWNVRRAREGLEDLEKLPENEREPSYEVELRVTRELVEAAEAYEQTDEAVRARVIYQRKTYSQSAQKRLSELRRKEEFGFLSPREEQELRITRERIEELVEKRKATA